MWTDPRFNGLRGERLALAHGRGRDRLCNEYAVLITRSGRGTLTCQGVPYQATRQSGYLFGPDQLCTARAQSRGSWRYEVLYISRQLFKTLIDQLEWSDTLLTAVARPRVLDAEALESGRRLCSVLRAPGLTVRRVAALVDFTEALFRDSGPGEMSNPEVGIATRIRRFVNDHYGDDVHNAQLARLVSRSPFHVIRVFKKAVGVPPHHYATLVRVRRAEELLRLGTPIAETAHQAGFCDQSHLSRCFHRTLGVTPGEYRNANCFHVRPRVTGERMMAYRLRTGERLWRYWARLRVARSSR